PAALGAADQPVLGEVPGHAEGAGAHEASRCSGSSTGRLDTTVPTIGPPCVVRPVPAASSSAVPGAAPRPCTGDRGAGPVTEPRRSTALASMTATEGSTAAATTSSEPTTYHSETIAHTASGNATVRKPIASR